MLWAVVVVLEAVVGMLGEDGEGVGGGGGGVGGGGWGVGGAPYLDAIQPAGATSELWPQLGMTRTWRSCTG